MMTQRERKALLRRAKASARKEELKSARYYIEMFEATGMAMYLTSAERIIETLESDGAPNGSCTPVG